MKADATTLVRPMRDDEAGHVARMWRPARGTGVRIRPATPQDAAAVEELLGQYKAEMAVLAREELGLEIESMDGDGSFLTATEGLEVLVAEGPDGIVGTAALRPTAPEGEVKRMYVVPALRGTGLGAALLDRVIATARARGLRSLWLETAFFLRDAIALYERTGFTDRPVPPEADAGRPPAARGAGQHMALALA